ncbi:hypothetical protein MLD38_007981 [Melastoma candidum]|uniref:Uncharacterized protein n=1 Tax=Melastoma candidum TaxID=119954 RepID=A0ACB9RVX7_9MYRT|nr:hypothetical protein MLD38_007981 [Melastoma candidum]
MGAVGCFSCFSKPERKESKDVTTKSLGSSRRREKKPSISEDFWSSSFFDMDHNAALSQRSISSIGTSNLVVNPQGSNSGASEFVNHGLLLWNQTRQQWVGNKKAESRGPELPEPQLSWNATYESLLGSNKSFARRIPLSEMVDFLVDIWQQEGMYD